MSELPLLLLALAVGAGIRNELVYRERKRMLDRISALADADIAAGRFYAWRRWYDLFWSVSYGAMLFQFWRPLRSFWPDELR